MAIFDSLRNMKRGVVAASVFGVALTGVFVPQVNAFASTVDGIDSKVNFTDGGKAIVLSQNWSDLAPGVKLAEVVRAEDYGNNHIMVTFTDLSKAKTRYIDSGTVSQGTKNVQDMAQAKQTELGQSKVLVDAVNASFFDIDHNRAAMGNGVDNGEVIKSLESPDLNNSSNDARPLSYVQIDANGVGSVHSTASVAIAKVGDKDADGVNLVQVDTNQMSVYTARWGQIPLSGYTVANDTAVQYLSIDAQGNVTAVSNTAPATPIPAGTYVVVARGTAKDKLAGIAQGAKAPVTITAKDGIQFAVSGDKFSRLFTAPSIPFVDDAAIRANNNQAGFTFNRHPRTAIGFRDGGKTMITLSVDGRRADLGWNGVDIPELGRLMKDMGATEAMNLDGGGSTQHVSLRPQTTSLTAISDTRDDRDKASAPFRKDGNGLAVVVDKGSDKPAKFITKSPVDALLKDRTAQLTATGVNENGFIVTGTPVWKSLTESIATVDQNGLVTAKGAGVATICAEPHLAETDCAKITVAEDFVKIGVDPEHINFSRAKTTDPFLSNFRVFGLLADGKRVEIDQTLVDTQLPADSQIDVSKDAAGTHLKRTDKAPYDKWVKIAKLTVPGKPDANFNLCVISRNIHEGDVQCPPEASKNPGPADTITQVGDEGAFAATEDKFAVLPNLNFERSNLGGQRRLQTLLKDMKAKGVKTLIIPGNFVRYGEIFGIVKAKEIIAAELPEAKVVYLPGANESGSNMAKVEETFGTDYTNDSVAIAGLTIKDGKLASSIASYKNFTKQIDAAKTDKKKTLVVSLNGLEKLSDVERTAVLNKVDEYATDGRKAVILSGAAATQTVVIKPSVATVTLAAQSDLCVTHKGDWQLFGKGSGQAWLAHKGYSLDVAGECNEQEQNPGLGLSSFDAGTNQPFTGANTPYQTQDVALAEPPAGFSQSYFAAFTRHGSRTGHNGPINDLITMLKGAKTAKSITKRGEELLDYLENYVLPAQKSIGESNLTIIGTEETTNYGVRLAKRHAELLASHADGTISLESSEKQRAKDTANNVAKGLKSIVSGAKVADNKPVKNVWQHQDIDNDAWGKERKTYLESDPEYLKVKNLPEKSLYPAAKSAAINLLSDFVSPEYAANQITGYCGGAGGKLYETRGLVAGMLKNINGGKPFPAVDLEAVREIQQCTAIDEWYKRGQGFDGQTVSYNDGKPALKDIFDHIDKSIKTPGEIGSIRASHNEILTPLNALLEVPGATERAKPGQLFNYDDFNFRQAETDPMGGNIEWVVYRNKGGKALVQILANEKPVNIGRGCKPIAEGSKFYDYNELKTCLPDVGQDKTPVQYTDIALTATGTAPATVAVGEKVLLHVDAENTGTKDIANLATKVTGATSKDFADTALAVKAKAGHDVEYTLTQKDIDAGKVDFTIVANAENGLAEKTASVSVKLNVPATVLVITPDKPVFNKNENITFAIAGFKKDEKVQIWLHSEPVLLGTVVAQADGIARGSFAVPAGTEVGEHSLIARGELSGEVAAKIQITETVKLENNEKPGNKLSDTGMDESVNKTLALIAVMLVVLGVVAFRRRRS